MKKSSKKKKPESIWISSQIINGETVKKYFQKNKKKTY